MQKLPVFRTFGNMLDSVIENLSTALALSWPWLLVLFPIRLAGDFYHYWLELGRQHPTGTTAAYNEADFIVGLLSAIVFASIAVNWHRYILRSEVAEGAQRLRLDALVWRYFFFGIIIGLLVALVMFGGIFAVTLVSLAFAAASKTLAIVLASLLSLPLFLLLIGASARWSVKLVAIALGDKDYSLSDAWRATIGNTWRLAGLELMFFIAIGMVGLLNVGAGYGSSLFNSSLTAAVVAAVTVLVGWFSTLMGITMLTSVYSFFVEKRVF